jgi:hypothetical protein
MPLCDNDDHFTHPTLLAKLSHSKIIHFSFYLLAEDLEKVLASSVFKDMISSDHTSHELLMGLCKVSGQRDLARYIIKNEFTSFRFTDDQLMQLISNVGRTRQPLSTNTDVCAKLSNAQLLVAISFDPSSFFQLGLERVDNYTAIELIQFAEIYLTPVRILFSEAIIVSVLARLLKELDRRAEDERSSMSGSQWLRMMGLHQNLGLFIAQHHLACLSDEDLSEARQRFGDYLEIEAAVSAELVRRDRLLLPAH